MYKCNAFIMAGPLAAMNAVLAIIVDSEWVIIVINREAVQINYFLL